MFGMGKKGKIFNELTLAVEEITDSIKEIRHKFPDTETENIRRKLSDAAGRVSKVTVIDMKIKEMLDKEL